MRFNIVTGFHSKQRTKQVESHALDGVVRFQEIPGGWDGTINIDRSNRALDDLIYQLEQLYYAGANVPATTMTETIIEPDGTVSQWRYEGVVIKYDDAGTKKADTKVPITMGWAASFRKKVI